MLSFRLLTTDEDLGLFTSLSCSLVGNQIPVSYFKAGRVVGAFLNEKMVGGWALTNPSSVPLRCHKMLPDENPRKPDIGQLSNEGLLSELTQVWLNSAVSSPLQAVRFWQRLAKDMLENANKNIIFGFRTTNTGLHNLYLHLNPQIIHAGPVKVGPDIKTHAQVTIMLIKRNAFKFLILRFAPNIMRRFFKKVRGVQKIEIPLTPQGGLGIETRKFEPNS